jgi:hypothetical protein
MLPYGNATGKRLISTKASHERKSRSRSRSLERSLSGVYDRSNLPKRVVRFRSSDNCEVAALEFGRLARQNWLTYAEHSADSA